MTPLPDLTSMRPKKAMRVFERFLADRDPLTGDALNAGEMLRKAIAEYELSFGRGAEEDRAKQNLRQRQATFLEAIR